MSNLIIVNQNNERVDLETAVELYKGYWGEIIRRELGKKCDIKSDNDLFELLMEQQLSRLEIFPEGQRAAIDTETGGLGGTIYSLLYHSSRLSVVKDWNDLTGYGYGTTHTPDGDSLICYAIQTNPDIKGAARMLVEAQRGLVAKLGKRLFVFTRPNGFNANLKDPNIVLPDDPEFIEQYLRAITEEDHVMKGDGVSFHTHLGAKLAPLLRDGKPYLPNSRPGDLASGGYNVLMEYSTNGFTQQQH